MKRVGRQYLSFFFFPANTFILVGPNSRPSEKMQIKQKILPLISGDLQFANVETTNIKEIQTYKP